jgi:hypothetical protein
MSGGELERVGEKHAVDLLVTQQSIVGVHGTTRALVGERLSGVRGPREAQQHIGEPCRTCGVSEHSTPPPDPDNAQAHLVHHGPSFVGAG